MNLEIGSEQRFFDFVSSLGKEDKIALISHTDLDGMAAAIVTNKVIDADIVMFVNYGDMDSKLAELLKTDGYNKVILTDLAVGQHPDFLKEIEKFSNVLILDHHPSADFNSPKITQIKSEEGYCAGYLCYELFKKTQDIEKLDWLVACSCVSDFCHIKTEDWLSEIYEKYGDKFEREGYYVRRSGKMWDLQWKMSLALIYFRENLKKVYDEIGEEFGDIGDLEKHASEVQREIDEILERFDNEKEEFEGGYYFEFNPKFAITSICVNILSGERYPEKTLVLVRFDNDDCKISLRRQDGKEDMNKLAERLIYDLEDSTGGGHVKAAGAKFLRKDLAEFKKRLGVIEK
ncbi:hypothetical protein COU60_02030 [Candidatus Pacearchaeota archaeon CG10_big_fil_rev_8_21_14_0_10_34_76]|nr:MAG: hypothetical protein COU60_02030 [Candidatus Pacearchaeota archaeon CG10_big_fil_rev_8_21_14_0_10_34_76]